MPQFRLSNAKYKKYDVWVPSLNKWIGFGDKRYEHYKTSNAIPRSLHVYPEHHDDVRRDSYRRRASKIKDASGHLTYKNKEKANYYAYHYLW